jgi:23S rRNA pseudouridine1911/1915/1917 synthase
MPLERALKEHFAGASWGAVRKLVETGKVSVDGKLAMDGRKVVPVGSTIALSMNAPRKKPSLEAPERGILYLDRYLVVVDKPEGLASVDHVRETTSLQSQLKATLEQLERRSLPELYVVHRLDKVTSGVMMFARNRSIQHALKAQFKAKTTGRFYWALAHGQVHDGALRFRLVRDRGDGIRGTTGKTHEGYPSVTHVTALEQLARCTLIRCKLETGRTHQIRIHLAAIGHPLLGETVYNRDYSEPLIKCSRTMLHAAFLGFDHPVHKQRFEYEAPLPSSFQSVLDQERRQRQSPR